MHKYQPRIHLVKRPDSGTTKPIVDLEKEPHKTFIFPEAIFTAVTAYQNQLVSFTLFLATVVHSCLSFCPFALFLAPRTLRLSLARPVMSVRSSGRLRSSASHHVSAARDWFLHFACCGSLSSSIIVSVENERPCEDTGVTPRGYVNVNECRRYATLAYRECRRYVTYLLRESFIVSFLFCILKILHGIFCSFYIIFFL